MAGVFEFQRQFVISRRGGTSFQQSVRREGDSCGKLAARYAPYVGRNAAAGMQQDVELHARFNGGQRLDHHRERWNLRGEHTAEANKDRAESNNSGEIHFASFDFTLRTA